MTPRDQASAQKPAARLLELGFEGYFMCRIATDPDPTNEERGVSGYTMALASERPLDQVIRLQPDPQDPKATELREPAEDMGVRIGVTVRSVRFDGKPYAPCEEALKGATVSLEGKNPPFGGPTFESRNNIVGSDDRMMFIINPFHLAVRGKGVTLSAKDHLNPADPEQPVWAIEDPSTYVRRLPVAFSSASTHVMSVLRVFDPYTYFQDRLRYLRERTAELERGARTPEVETRIQEIRSRIFQIEFWGDRVFSKMSSQLTYSFRINGEQEVKLDGERNPLGGEVDCAHPWLFDAWFGGWDGDLLVGYVQGTLGVPFRPDGKG